MERMEARHCHTKAEAEALANFLWNEKLRHMEDIRVIEEDIDNLKKYWNITPVHIREFVIP
jgi:hypothetical protein